jgi:predicted HAD superfamily Cof-like phosphohydrolase
MGEDADPEVIIGALERQLDALVDSIYVKLGTAYLQFGADRFREAWRRVVVANMGKVRADAAVEGSTDSGREKKYDIVKPPGWTAPDHKDLVRDHEPLNEG